MSARTVDEIAAALVGFINREIMAPGHAVTAAESLDAAGVDSMALLKVLLFIERTFGFWVPDEDLVDAHVATAERLARYVVTRGAAG